MENMYEAVILLIIFYAIFIGLAFVSRFVSPNTSRISRDELVIGRTSIPWSNIKNISLKKSEYGNIYLLIHLRDGTSPKSFDTEYLKNRKEFFHHLQDTEKRFTFTVDEDVDIDAAPVTLSLNWKEELSKIKEAYQIEKVPGIETSTEETPARVKPKKEINISTKQKLYIMVTLAAVFIGGLYILIGLTMTVSLFLVVLVHEMGHLLVLKLCGMKAHGIFFIPFIGAGVLPKDEFPSPEVEAAIALGGPAIGLSWNLAAQILDASANATFSMIFVFIVLLNLLVNLLNLLPILPLDGGRVVRAALLRGRKSLIPVIVITFGSGIIAGVYFKSIFFVVVAVIGLGSLVYSFNKVKKKEVEPPVWWKSVLILGTWVSIIWLLWYGCPANLRAIGGFLLWLHSS
ncbi:MAG: site-2 protease family protein [Theionarchaea archaeon]|nr:site-2 protease family protein [Theionarchaea archaeon]